MTGGFRSLVRGVSGSRKFARATALLAVAGALAVGGSAPGRSAALQGTADLHLGWSKSPRTAIVLPGKVVRYSITVANDGPDAAPGVTADIGVVLESAKISSSGTSGGDDCTYEEVLPDIAGFVHCPLGMINPGASKTATLRIRASRSAAKTGGAILISTLSALSEDTSDPDESNSFLVFLPDDAIQYSISGKLGGGKATPRRIRARVLIAPEPQEAQNRSLQRYRRVDVFQAPPGASVELRSRGVVETGRTSRAGKLRSRKLVDRPLVVGSVFTVKVTKPGRIGDFLRIKVIAGGAALAKRQCVPLGGGPPRSSCR